MRGSKRPKSGGRWELRADIAPHPITGRRRTRSRTIRGTSREADRELARFVLECAEDARGSESMTMTQLHRRWVSHLETRGRSPSTIASYNSRWRVIENSIGLRPVSEITAESLDALYDHLLDAQKGTATISKVHVQLRAMFNQALKWGVIRSNPATMATPPSHRPTPTPIPDFDEFRQFLAHVKSRDRQLSIFLRVLYITGARKSEIIALRWNDLREGAVRISASVCEATEGRGLILKSTKTGQHASVAIDPGTYEELSRLLDERKENCRATCTEYDPYGYIFTDHPLGIKPWRPSTVSHRLRRLRIEAQVSESCTAMAARALCATALAAEGVNPVDVKDRLRHSSISTTYAHYIRSLPEASSRSAELLAASIADQP